MNHDYKKFSKVLFAALENVPEEESTSVRKLISECFSDYKYVPSSYSEEEKKHINPYSLFNGEKWNSLELLDFALYFFRTARKSKFFLDATKYTGGFYGTPPYESFFVRRKPVSKTILFQIKEYDTRKKSDIEIRQVQVYSDGAVKFKAIENIGIKREYVVDKKSEYIEDSEKPLKKTLGGTYLVNKKIVEGIKNIYKEKAAVIKALPQNVDNGYSNRYLQEFSFRTKKVTCYNINAGTEAEKTILQIFTEIKNLIDSLTPENEWKIQWKEFSFQ